MIIQFLILAESTRQTLFSTKLLILYAFFLGLIIIAAVIFIRFLGSGMKEMKLMRMEVGKLAEELRLLRNELKERRESGSSTK